MNALPTSCFEFVVAGGTSHERLSDDWPFAAGAVRRTEAGRAVLLHFAPWRWLVPDPDADIAARLGAHVDAGVGVLIDVTGKWRGIALSGADMPRVLAAGVAVDIVLAARDCAALWLFDCPVILARDGATLDLWVQSSYAPSLMATLESVRDRIKA